MSEHKRNYDVFKGLLNGQQINTLSHQQIQAVVLGKAQVSTEGSIRLLVLHDGCDIRKPNSDKMEHLGSVLSLQKNVINGYKSMESVAINPDNQTLDLVFQELYSTKLPNFVSQEVVNNPDLASPNELELIQSGEYINTKTLYHKSINESHKCLKMFNPNVVLTHISDREFDDVEDFKMIDDLGDEFVTRLKLSRLSNELATCYTPKGKISKRQKYVKLIDKKFTHQGEYTVTRLIIKGKIYLNAIVHVEWESLQLDEKSYNVVRITLMKSDRKNIFEHPMLLITNRLVDSLSIAKEVYHAYISRFRIEIVFKFIKQNLGLETFQVRDWESIKNILALCFFLVGYFKELEEELKKHPIAQFLSQIALSKGKVTAFFLLKGLEKIANFIEIKHLIDQNLITQDQIDDLFEKIGFKNQLLRSYYVIVILQKNRCLSEVEGTDFTPTPLDLE